MHELVSGSGCSINCTLSTSKSSSNIGNPRRRRRVIGRPRLYYSPRCERTKFDIGSICIQWPIGNMAKCDRPCVTSSSGATTKYLPICGIRSVLPGKFAFAQFRFLGENLQGCTRNVSILGMPPVEFFRLAGRYRFRLHGYFFSRRLPCSHRGRQGTPGVCQLRCRLLAAACGGLTRGPWTVHRNQHNEDNQHNEESAKLN